MTTNTRFDSHLLIDNRQIKIFLSSTFSDMQEERSALIKTFEKLKLTAVRRNVTFSVLDLRWGVTDEESRGGKVISVCLNEIEHSHPFFIGLLGCRYGYAPEASELKRNPDLLERYPWLADDIAAGRSITEMEMLYGVLRNEGNIDAAFYIKQTAEPDDNPRQTALKEKIRSQRKYPVGSYATVEELCAMVEHEVMAMLDRHFPDGEHTPLERERTAQRAYINSRHAHFVGREEDLVYIDAFAHSDRRHLVITGESGMGKSALLANWIRRNEKCSDFHLVYHFVGNSLSGNNYQSILRHLCDEIYDIYHIKNTSDKDEKLEDEAQRLVIEVERRQQPLVVVIDGINQITAPDDEKLLLWLPVANDKVKYIFTTLPTDTTMQTFQRRDYEIYTLMELSAAQRRSFTINYLEQVGKHLSEHQLDRIIEDPENRNTLVMRTLLDELICFGLHEQLDARIDYYLSAASVSDFFDRVLQRMEKDYDNGQELVSHALKLIALSERGISEEELLAITGFRQMDWHLFFCAFFNHLVVKEGLIVFSHQYIAEAVANRYSTADASASATYRKEIVAYFVSQHQSHRRISELAYQYYHLADGPDLYRTLLDYDAIRYFSVLNRPQLALYWRALMAMDSSRYRLSDYLQQPYSDEDGDLVSFVESLGTFVSDYFGDHKTALEFSFKALKLIENKSETNPSDLAVAYSNIGTIYDELGDTDKALEYGFKALAIREKNLGEEDENIATSYNNIACAYDKKYDFDRSLEYHIKALAIYEKVCGAEHPNTALSYSNIGYVYNELYDLEKSLEYYIKSLKIRENKLGVDHLDTANTYNNIGSLYDDMGDFDHALEYYLKALAVNEKILGPEHPDVAMICGNIGDLYNVMGDYGKAKEYLCNSLEIKKRVYGTEHLETATGYSNMGLLYDDMGDFKLAIEYYGKALGIREKMLGFEHPDTATSYFNIGSAYSQLGDYNQAQEYYNRALVVVEKVYGKNHPETATCYSCFGVLYNDKGDYRKALDYHLKALAIREKVLGPEHPDTADTYNNIGTTYYYLEDLEKAQEYFQKARMSYEKIYGMEHERTATAYGNIASLYGDMGDQEQALEYILKSLAISKKVLGGNHPDTATAYNNVGTVYDDMGDSDMALKYYRKALKIREKTLGLYHPDTAGSYNNIAWVYDGLDDRDKALKYYHKALSIFKAKLGDDHPYTVTVQKNIDELNSRKGVQ